jgi:hypothetical protein
MRFYAFPAFNHNAKRKCGRLINSLACSLSSETARRSLEMTLKPLVVGGEAELA